MKTDIKNPAILPASGRIERASAIEPDAAWSLENPFLLERGELLEVVAGSAFLVQDGKAWRRVHFFREGRLVGPMLASGVKPEDPAAVLRREDNSSNLLLMTAVPLLCFTILLGGAALDPGTDPGVNAILAGLAAIFALAGAIMVGRYIWLLRLQRVGGSAAISRLHKVAGSDTFRVRLSQDAIEELAA